MKNIDISADLISPKVALSLIPAFTSAYGMALSAVNSFDFLGWDLKYQILPYLKNWAVEYELHRRAKDGSIPFESSLVPNHRKNHRHVELQKNDFILTISQTPSIEAMPRECVFRNEHCLDGQIAITGFEEGNYSCQKSIYAILTHGGLHAPSYILCGIPMPAMKGWAQHINLFDVAKGLEIIDTSPITDEITLLYRDEVEPLVRLKGSGDAL